MGSTAIIVSIDKELARLHGLREKLVKQGKNAQKDKRTAKKKTAPAVAKKKAKRQLSPGKKGKGA